MNFYCLSPAARKGFLLSISRFFLGSTRNHLLSPEVGAYPPRYPQGCSQAGGSSLRKLPALAAYAKVRASDREDDLPRGMARLLVADRRAKVVEWIPPVDDGRQPAVLDELSERHQRRFFRLASHHIRRRDSRRHEGRQRERADHVTGGLQPAASRTADHNEPPVASNDPAVRRDRTAARDVDDYVEAAAGLRNVLGDVVDDVIRADGPDQLGVARAAGTGDRGAQSPRDLNGMRSDAPGGPGDQHLVAGLNRASVPDRQQRRDSRHRHRRRLLIRQAPRHRGQQLVAHADHLREAAMLEQAEHIVARTERSDGWSGSLDLARYVAAQDAQLRAEQAHAPGQQAGD